MLALVAVGGWWAASNRSASSYTLAELSRSDSRLDIRSLATLAFESRAGGTGRVVYPYSVVPGGVRDARELRQQSADDPVVASHYAGFDFRRAKVVVLQQPRLVYLSYRIKDKIFWTKKKVSLRKGETLITDGNIIARTRCANRISDVAQKAVSPVEPAAAVLDQPVGPVASEPVAMVALPEGFESALESRPTPAGFGVAIPPVGGGGGGGGVIPPVIVPPPPAGGCGKDPCSQTPPVPPTPVPEPSSILLASSALAGIYLRYRKSKLLR
jgi:hypothetical protein